MAVLAHTEVTKRLPIGDRVLQVFRVTPGAAAADEWIATGLSWVDAVLGVTVKGATPWADTSTSADPVGYNAVYNANGTGQSEGSTSGSVGIEIPTSKTVDVTVIGRP